MLFNSFRFLIFLTIVLAIYFGLPNRFRKVFLLLASYCFYAFARPEYVLLLMFITAVNYMAGLQIGKTEKQSSRNFWLVLCLMISLGNLFFFKYFNFFNDSARLLFDKFNIFYGIPHLNIILPIGISFFTLQALNYTIDVYRKKIPVENNLLTFSCYVAYFPQLLAGPIGRAASILPQYLKNHDFDYERLRHGLQLILWGLFKKMVIADRLAILVNQVYDNPSQHNGLGLLVATYFFAFQIFCDFSGYSDIAIGIGQIMGFDLMQNFERPYHASSINEFWKRWHISLTSWFRDYIWMVLRWPWYRSIFLVFVLSGLWHGANWTFILWGALNGFYLIFAIWSFDFRKKLYRVSGLKKIPRIHKYLKVFITFHLILFGWIFFRANSLSDAFYVIGRIGASLGSLLANIPHPARLWASLFEQDIGLSTHEFAIAIIAILMMECIHLLQGKKDLRDYLDTRPIGRRWAIYYIGLFSLLLLGIFHSQRFIYFQF
jgi:alginate O-acetyltransferase complex protein AlgI